jgi:hypothetical protein
MGAMVVCYEDELLRSSTVYLNGVVMRCAVAFHDTGVLMNDIIVLLDSNVSLM